MDSHTQYRLKEERIVSQLQEINRQGGLIAVAKRTSNLFRARKQTTTPKLDFRDLNKVIAVDKKKLIAEVEAATLYRDLVDETLKHGLLPAVVPQFTTITIGGGISGGACEASSFKYGATHETIKEMRVLLSDGRVVTATPDNEYKDLFLASANTFGSLGYILNVKVKLVSALPFIKLEHFRFSDSKKYFDTIERIMKTEQYNNEKVDFLDGMITDKKNFYLTIARFTKKAPYTSNYKYMNIYYQSITTRQIDYLTTRDFIWRWDADWAWGSKAFGMQNKALRLLFGKFMLNSFSYWKLVSLDRKYKIMEKINSLTGKRGETIVQDSDIPITQSRDFLDYFLDNFTLRPIWVCPLKSYKPIFYPFVPLDPKTNYINFGFWGSVDSSGNLAANHYNRMLEKASMKYGGYKALYSEVFFTPAEFWKLHDKKQYDRLKKKYDQKNRLRDFYQKVINH